jgi:hypothetical protein
MAATICIKVVVLTAPPLRFELFFFGDFALFFDFLDGDLAGLLFGERLLLLDLDFERLLGLGIFFCTCYNLLNKNDDTCNNCIRFMPTTRTRMKTPASTCF